MTAVADQLCDLQRRLKGIERALQTWHHSNEASSRLATIPGIGTITASAIVATVGNPREFKSARHFAAFLGLTPKEHSTGGRHRLGRISKQGDVYIRRLLILGGTSLTVCPRRRRFSLGKAVACAPANPDCDGYPCQ